MNVMNEYLIEFTCLVNGNHFAEQDTVFADTAKQAVAKVKQRYSFEDIHIDSVYKDTGFKWEYVDSFAWED